jgi:hypothetical protein
MARPPSRKHVRASDLQGLARLAEAGTAGAARLAEGAHASLLEALGLETDAAAGRTRGLTGLVYGAIHGLTRLVGRGAESTLAALRPALEAADTAGPGSPEREAVLAALNGVLGDRLAADGNPLALPMTLRHGGADLDRAALTALPGVKGRVLLLIHGLCMNDLQWRSERDGGITDHGAALAPALDATLLHLRYNSGLHVAENGRALSAQLEQLLASWPAALEELSVVAHSMGGLLIRSALHAAGEEGRAWPARLKRLVFLGTPHHGAPLERAGNHLETILGATPLTAPFTRIGQVRSAGITDLRYGHLLDSDGEGGDRFASRPDARTPVPLPAGVACFAVAGTTAPGPGRRVDGPAGDGLVPVASALGRHADPSRTLAFPPERQWLAYGTNHVQLLGRAEVTAQLLAWMAPGP